MWLNVLPLLLLYFISCSMCTDDELYEGSSCTLEDGSTGICKVITDCPPRLEEVRQGRRDWGSTGRCGFRGLTEVVCCPGNVTEKVGLRPSALACQNYMESRDNGVQFHIIEGEEAKPLEFPYMVALGYINNGTDYSTPIIYTCGGTLISTKHVLTAAHCAKNTQGAVPIEVKMGTVDIQSTEDVGQRIPIADIILHPRYKRTAYYNDLAILELKQEVKLSDSVWPLCLHTESLDNLSLKPDVSLVVIGWGYTNHDGILSNKLMKTPSLSLVDRNNCGKLYTQYLKLPRGLDENMICARDMNTTRNADACQGDSGGPLLMLSRTGGNFIVGITSFGQMCGSPAPAVYMAVYPYLDWIEEQVWPSKTRQ